MYLANKFITINTTKINEITSKIATKFNPNKIILFGSHANNIQNPNSDIDLLIVQDSDLPMQKRGLDIRLALMGFKTPMDILIYTPAEFEQEKNNRFSFINSIIKNSKILYERAD